MFSIPRSRPPPLMLPNPDRWLVGRTDPMGRATPWDPVHVCSWGLIHAIRYIVYLGAIVVFCSRRAFYNVPMYRTNKCIHLVL